jgi:hypothetical protein
MIRLLLALAACLALHPSLAPSGAAGGGERGVAVDGGSHVAAPVIVDASAGGMALPSLTVMVAAPAWGGGGARAAHSFVVVARRWLCTCRLLC